MFNLEHEVNRFLFLFFKEHYLSHLMDDVQNLAPLPLLCTDVFEQQHSPYKQCRVRKRTSVNILKTLLTHHEKLSVYHATTELIPTPVEKKIRKPCLSPVAKEYMKQSKIHGSTLYECSFLKVYGTQYQKNQFVILNGSTNKLPSFGQIQTLLCCEKKGYVLYNRTSSEYCDKTDLFFVTVQDQQEITAISYLADYHPLQGSALSYSLAYHK